MRKAKELPFEEAAPGAVGLETILPASLSLYHNKILSLNQLFRLLAFNPANIIKKSLGCLDEGQPADIIIFDPDKPVKIDRFQFRSKSQNTPFDGFNLQGENLLTMVEGEIIFKKIRLKYDSVMSAFVIIFVAYLIGSIPFGFGWKLFFKIQDPRTFGSKNIGATNILRSGNKKAAAFTLFFDMFKGFFAVFIASYIETDLIYLAILAVVFGHIFPIYLLFKGGKGVATFLGALLSYSSVVGGLTLLTWITVFYLTRKSSVAGISAIVLSNFFLLFFCDNSSIKLSALLLSIFILFKHSENIKRLLKKEELSFEGRDKN